MAADEHETVIPIVAEELTLAKRDVETDRVRVRTVVDERAVDLVTQVARGTLAIERRGVEREVTEAPPPREDGDTLILSIVEERPVVTKRLFVIEEVVIRRTERTEDVHVPTTLRTMRAVVERDGDQA